MKERESATVEHDVADKKKSRNYILHLNATPKTLLIHLQQVGFHPNHAIGVFFSGSLSVGCSFFVFTPYRPDYETICGHSATFGETENATQPIVISPLYVENLVQYPHLLHGGALRENLHHARKAPLTMLQPHLGRA